MKNLLIDTDPGIDDAVALLFAMGCGKLDIKAITTVSGNNSAARCSINARKILELCGARHIPVACGQATPLVRPFPYNSFSHGSDGMGDAGLGDPTLEQDPRFAPDLLIEMVDRHAGDISILGIGPLTNLALAVTKDPTLPRKVTELVVLGGAYGFDTAWSSRATGENPVSEWNFFFDPEAAKIVFEAGFKLTAIGLDITAQSTMILAEADRVRLRLAETPAAQFLLDCVAFLESRGYGAYGALIDSLAVAALIDPDVITTEVLRVNIETKGEFTLGQTVVERRQRNPWTNWPLVQAAASVDIPRFFNLLIDSLCHSGMK
jgi:purine nucleosidase/pyrimidine-specific ribonucleoside hydrolase